MNLFMTLKSLPLGPMYVLVRGRSFRVSLVRTVETRSQTYVDERKPNSAPGNQNWPIRGRSRSRCPRRSWALHDPPSLPEEHDGHAPALPSGSAPPPSWFCRSAAPLSRGLWSRRSAWNGCSSETLHSRALVQQAHVPRV